MFRRTHEVVVSDEEREALLAEVPCLFCGGWHTGECLRVREVQFDAAGKVLVAKYWKNWDKTTTVFPHDLEDEARVSLSGQGVSWVKAKIKKVSDKVQDALWTSSYFSWATRVVAVVATFAITATLVIGMLSLVIHLFGVWGL